MKDYILLLLLSFMVSSKTFAAPTKPEKLNNRPIIAILAQRFPWEANQSYIAASYVKYLESAGARVVPIPHYFSKSKIKEIFKYVNGVLYPGGGILWFTSDFYKHAKQFWDLAIQANDEGTYFPVWGSCLGLETMHVIRTNKVVTSKRISNDLALPLNFSSDAKSSRLFEHIPKDLYAALESEDLTYNHHNWGIAPETYSRYPKLKDFFKILSVNNDVNGKQFISTIEAYKYPIYGVQWHPEKNNFEFTTSFKNIPHSYNAVRASQYVANFFVNEARKNFQRFPTKKMEDDHLIYRYAPIHSAAKYKKGSLRNFEQVYFF